MDIEVRFSPTRGFAVMKIEDEGNGDVLTVDMMSQSQRTDALIELLAAAEALSNPRTPLAALLNGALAVAYMLESEAGRE